MKIILFCFIGILSCSLGKVEGQVSNYDHAPVIAGQQDLHLRQGQSIVINPDSLIIGDLDTADYSNYSVILEPGKNYRLQNNKVIPDPSFTGILYIPCRVKDPVLSSNTYPLEIIVYPMGKMPSFATTRFYVAGNGKDTGNGTFQSPFITIEKALEQVKKWNLSSRLPKGGIEIIVRGGIYPFERTLVLDEQVSGVRGKPVIIKSYPGEKVFFEGGYALPFNAFKPLTDPAVASRMLDPAAAKKIKVINLWELGIKNIGAIARRGYGFNREGILPEVVLTVNGQSQMLSRYPNESYSNMIDTVLDDKQQFITKDKHIRLWKNKQDIWLDGSITKPWEWSMNQIESIHDASLTITLHNKEYGEISTKNNPIYHFKNILEEIDIPGEYYIDRSNGNLYYLPTEDFREDAHIYLTGLEKDLVQFTERSHDIWLEGIQLENGRTNGIIMSGERNKLKQCKVRGFNRAGVLVSGKYNELVDCHIEYTGMEGVVLNHQNDDDKHLIPTANVLKRCEVNNFSNWFRAYTPGIKVSNVGTGISHCKLHDAPHFAIGYNGNDHVLEYTEIYRAPNEFSDMLSVYFNTGNNPQHRGSVIRRNYFHDVNTKWKQGAGVYLDNETYGVAVMENIFYNSGGNENGWSVMVHGGGDNLIRNNIFIDCRYPFLVSTRLNGYAKDKFEGRLASWSKLFKEEYHLLDTGKVAHLKKYPELIHFFDDDNKAPATFNYTYNIKKDENGAIVNYWNLRTPATNVFENNLVFNAKPGFFRMKAAIEGITENRIFYTVNSFPVVNGKMKDNLIHHNNHFYQTDPGFVNYQNQDFQLKTDAPVLQQIPALGKIPFHRIGMVGDE